MRALRRD